MTRAYVIQDIESGFIVTAFADRESADEYVTARLGAGYVRIVELDLLERFTDRVAVHA